MLIHPCRLPVLQGRHFPSDKSLALTKPALWLRVTLATTILRLLGQGRKARFLDNSHKTFNVQNTMGYAYAVTLCHMAMFESLMQL